MEFNLIVEVLNDKKKMRSYTAEFKREAVLLVTEQGYRVPKAAASLGITDKLLYNWKAKFEAEQSGANLNVGERAKLLKLRKEVKDLIVQIRLYIFQQAIDQFNPIEFVIIMLRYSSAIGSYAMFGNDTKADLILGLSKGK